ncbi:MAG: 2-amino-4-hydroxy-6-hydroxymethyldihydropteridine diphosphokinase [Gaiellales bacterium]|jgi:2-amino-4-hydroxy-6-hydroxymethyldihydropteridine diphosphokinase
MARPAKPPSRVTLAYVGLGANLGDARATLAGAVESLADLGEVRAVSPLYETDPIGLEDQPPFLNAVAVVATSLDPHGLLAELLAIEARFGRERTIRWGPRTLDLDLLAMDGVQLDEPQLTVPHPRLAEREFALRPLADVAPGVPIGEATAGELLAALEPQGVRPAGTLR